MSVENNHFVVSVTHLQLTFHVSNVGIKNQKNIVNTTLGHIFPPGLVLEARLF